MEDSSWRRINQIMCTTFCSVIGVLICVGTVGVEDMSIFRALIGAGLFIGNIILWWKLAVRLLLD